MSCYLAAFELTNQLLYMNFSSLERKIFQKDLKSTLPSSVALRFRNLGNGGFPKFEAFYCSPNMVSSTEIS